MGVPAAGTPKPGYLAELWYSSNAGTAYTKVFALTSANLQLQYQTADATDHDSGAWSEQVAIRASWSIDVECLYEEDPTGADLTNVNQLFDAALAGTTLRWKLHPLGTAAPYATTPWSASYYGNGIITSHTFNADQNDVSRFSFTVQGTGALTQGVGDGSPAAGD